MDGFFKKIGFVILFLTVINCKKNEELDIQKNKLVLDGKSLIKENSYILIDSLENYDLRFLNKNKKSEPFTVGLLDSIAIDKRYFNYGHRIYNYLTFKLKKNDLSNFKSPYKLNLIKSETYDSNVLFIEFSNLKIEEDKAEIIVKKIRGISSIINRYYFKKKNNRWVFIRKQLLSMA